MHEASTRKPKSETQCKFYREKGFCRDGNACEFLHGSFVPAQRQREADGAEANARIKAQLEAFIVDSEVSQKSILHLFFSSSSSSLLCCVVVLLLSLTQQGTSLLIHESITHT